MEDILVDREQWTMVCLGTQLTSMSNGRMEET
jgi:hypothetical protein